MFKYFQCFCCLSEHTFPFPAKSSERIVALLLLLEPIIYTCLFSKHEHTSRRPYSVSSLSGKSSFPPPSPGRRQKRRQKRSRSEQKTETEPCDDGKKPRWSKKKKGRVKTGTDTGQSCWQRTLKIKVIVCWTFIKKMKQKRFLVVFFLKEIET